MVIVRYKSGTEESGRVRHDGWDLADAERSKVSGLIKPARLEEAVIIEAWADVA